MATAAAAIDQAAISKPVDGSLWWDSFVELFEELDAVSLSDDLPDHLVKKVKSNRAWLLESVARFKRPNTASRYALDSTKLLVGSQQLDIKPSVKEMALRASSCLCLDEVQSYILVNRSIELNKHLGDKESEHFFRVISTQYFFERQCLLKCIRRLFVHALCLNNDSCSTNYAKEEALQLFHDGLEMKLFSVLTDLLSSVTSESSDNTDVDYMILWVEESIIEDNLVLDIFFLAYYDNFCSCSCEHWKNLCSLFKDMLSGLFSNEKLAVSVEARRSFDYAKKQLLLILIETLDLENLLRMVHDEVPFRQGLYIFSLSDIQEMDVLVSSFPALGSIEAGPLILAWAVFICLLSTLPEKTDYSTVAEIDHVGYLHQAFQSGPFCYIHEVVRDTMNNSDGPVSGYLSVLRTLIAAFIASYELNQQADDSTLNSILDILCEIYSEEESLCMQFWDRESLVDGPIRSILHVLENEYPLQTVQLVRFLSSLCSGAWSAQCVYNYLEKMRGITLLSEIPGGSQSAKTDDIIENQSYIDIPTIEGVVIPSRSPGRILRFIADDTALVRWEFAHSGLFLLLLRLAQKSGSFRSDDASILELFGRMISSNTALCFSLLHIEKSVPTRDVQSDGHIEMNVRLDMVQVISILVFNLLQDVNNAHLVAVCIKILAEMLKCAPTRVVEVVSRSNIFGMTNIGSSSTWLLSGGLARMLLSDSGESNDCLLLTTSVLDFTNQLMENGGEGDLVSALVVFSLQYVLVNHVSWNYKMKYARWKVTLKVLQVVKNCTETLKVSHRIGRLIREILMFDSSIHSFLCHVLCISLEDSDGSTVGHHTNLKVNEDLQLSVCTALDIVHALLADVLKENLSTVPIFVQNMLSSATMPVSLVTATIALLCFHEKELQVSSAKLFSVICVVAATVQPYTTENISLVVDSMQIKMLRTTICQILDPKMNANDEVLISMFELLTTVACYQPALLVSVMANEGDAKVTPQKSGLMKNQINLAPDASVSKTNTVDLVLEYVRRADTYINSAPSLLLNVLNLLKALWDGGVQYIHILDKIRTSDIFWKQLALAAEVHIDYSMTDNESELQCMIYRYRCHGLILEIMARELFLQEKLLQNEKLEMKAGIRGSKEQVLSSDKLKPSDLLPPNDILLTWSTSSTMNALIRSFSSSAYDKEAITRAKRAACLCIVHLMALVSAGTAGNLSVSLVERINGLYAKLREHPAFSSLLAHYSQQGYSEGHEVTSLLLNDLYYHLHGELQGRQIHVGAFQEISNFLLEFGTFQNDEFNDEKVKWPPSVIINMFDVTQLRKDLGIDLWDHSGWKSSKEVAGKMLSHMHKANLVISMSDSKHSSMEALIPVISLYCRNVSITKTKELDRSVSKKLTEPSIRYLCDCLQKTLDSLVPSVNPPVILLKILGGQAELLLVLSIILFKQNPLSHDKKLFLDVSSLLIKTSCSGIRFLDDVRPSSIHLIKAVKFLLMLFLVAVEFSYLKAYEEDNSDKESDLEADHLAGISVTTTGLLPILCKYIEHSEYCDLSAASLDIMVKVFLTPNTWFPIIEKHLRLQHVVQRIQQKEALDSVHVILNFVLTLSRTKNGAKLLYSANLFTSLKELFSHLMNSKPFSSVLDGSDLIFNADEALKRLWGLGLAIITSMIYSLGDDPSCMVILDNIIRYFFFEKAYIVSSYLSVPSFVADDNSKKRSRNQQTQTSLNFLRLTEDTLTLMCVLARHHALWRKGTKEMDSELRERSIHLLAFTSKSIRRTGDSPNKFASFMCPPTLKEEVELNDRPSILNIKQGWFRICALGYSAKTKPSAVPERGLLLLAKDPNSGNVDVINPTQFSDTVAIQMYKIAFLLLKFLCLQAKAAVKRAEEFEFIDLAHFPELPMPEILHGLQDQAIAIVTEVCNSTKQTPVRPETQAVCFLLMQILEKSLYLELCVSKSCCIRSMSGRVEDFSKEIKLMAQAVEHHTKFKASLRSLSPIIEQLYPGFSQTCRLI